MRREGARQRARSLPRHTTKHLPPTTDETSEGERRATSVRPLASNTARATTVRNGKRLHNKRSESVSARHQQTATRAASRVVGVTVRFNTIAHFAPVVADRGDKPYRPPNSSSATPPRRIRTKEEQRPRRATSDDERREHTSARARTPTRTIDNPRRPLQNNGRVVRKVCAGGEHVATALW